MCDNKTCSPSDSSFDPCSLDAMTRSRYSASFALSIATSAVVAILSPVAVAGNALVLAAIWKNPALRTPSYIILCGLAFTDFCTGLITKPLFVAVQIICLEEVKDIRQLSFLVYNASEVCGTYFSSLTLLLITLVSIERWLHMSRRSLLTVRRSCVIMALLYLLMIPFTLLYMTRFHEVVWTVILFVILIFCAVTTSISYFRVFRIIRRHQEQIQANEFSQNVARPAIDFMKYKKSVFSIMYILAIFYISYLPFCVMAGLFLSKHRLPMGYSVPRIIVLLSSSLNPVIYIWRMNDIRNGVKHLLKKLICKT